MNWYRVELLAKNKDGRELRFEGLERAGSAKEAEDKFRKGAEIAGLEIHAVKAEPEPAEFKWIHAGPITKKG